jgi:hypothetical protein
MGTDMIVPLLPGGAEVTAEATPIVVVLCDRGTPGVQVELFCLADFVDLPDMITAFVFSPKVAAAIWNRAMKRVFWEVDLLVLDPVAFLGERPTTPA